MDNQDKIRFASCMMGLGEIFNDSPSKEKTALYWELLKDLPIEAVERNVKRLCLTRTTASFPKPAEIREVDSISVEDMALKALISLETAIKDYGAYRTIAFQDSALNSIVEHFEGGWPGLCKMSLDEFKWFKKDFIKLYRAHQGMGESVPLLGIADHQNILNGDYDKPKNVVRIGREQTHLLEDK